MYCMGTGSRKTAQYIALIYSIVGAHAHALRVPYTRAETAARVAVDRGTPGSAHRRSLRDRSRSVRTSCLDRASTWLAPLNVLAVSDIQIGSAPTVRVAHAP